MVTPKWSFTVLKSPSGIVVMQNVRWGVRALLNDVFGVLNGRGGETSASLRRWATLRNPSKVRRSRAGRFKMAVIHARTAPVSSWRCVGTGSGCHGAGVIGGASGDVSRTDASMAAAATPSAAQWWILAT